MSSQTLLQQAQALFGKCNEAIDFVKGMPSKWDEIVNGIKSSQESWEVLQAERLKRVGIQGKKGTIYQRAFQGFFGSIGDSGFIGAEDDFANTELVRYDSGNSTSAYLHFKLPWRTDVDSKMFHMRFGGHVLFSSAAITTLVSGYCYRAANQVTHTSKEGNFDPHVYKGSDNHVYVRLKAPSWYYTTLTIDTMQVGNGTELKQGDIKVIASTAEEL